MENPVGTRRVRRVRHEIRQRNVEIVRIAPVGANFISITFKGEELDGFLSESFDDHVKFIFEDAGGEQQRRDYTPRYFNPEARELTIEFARHGKGKACEWAVNAKVGQRAIIGGPRGSMIIPEDYDWHLLAGDETALPAIGRRLEELPGGSRVIVVALAGLGDRREFAGRAEVDVRWVDSVEELISVVRGLQLPEGEGFAWCAGEAAAMARLRGILQEKGIGKENMRVAAYWKLGASSFHENLE